jgi:hypothetical protein
MSSSASGMRFLKNVLIGTPFLGSLDGADVVCCEREEKGVAVTIFFLIDT